MIGPNKLLLLLAVCLGVGVACGPSATTTGRTTPASKLTPEERFAMRQEAMCDALAPRITACAVEDARKNLTEHELEKQGLNDPAFLSQYTNQVRGECSLKEISMRQIELFKNCAAQESDCTTFLSCLETQPEKSN